LKNESFAQALRQTLERYRDDLAAALSESPFSVPLRFSIWGEGGTIQWQAMYQYYLIEAFPDLFDCENLLRALNYVLGCHMASDFSLVSGVGPRSVTSAYGTNRADWSYIPGGTVSGPNVIGADYYELKQPFPFVWQQSEYVIGSAATFIFCVLAADRLLNG